jgi:ammonium transporter Rh
VKSSADLVIQPWGALLIGTVAGTLSVIGYVYIQPFLERKIKLHDTCGVHNLHGMPGMLGCFGGAVSAALASATSYGQATFLLFPARAPSDPNDPQLLQYTSIGIDISPGEDRTAQQQGGYQVASLMVTLCIAIGSGYLAGKIASSSLFYPLRTPFKDGGEWNVHEDDDHGHEKAEESSQMYLEGSSVAMSHV